MRRQLLQMLLVGLACALLLQGLGGALAANCCHHARGLDGACAREEVAAPAHDAVMPGMESRDSCHMTMADSAPPASTLRATNETGITVGAGLVPARAWHLQSGQGQALPLQMFSQARVFLDALNISQPLNSCADCCVGRSGQSPAPTLVRQPNRTTDDLFAPALQAPQLHLPDQPSHAPAHVAARDAPPGHARRHLLNSIFLI